MDWAKMQLFCTVENNNAVALLFKVWPLLSGGFTPQQLVNSLRRSADLVEQFVKSQPPA